MEILNKNELSDYLKVELKTINYLLYSKKIPRIKIGKTYRFIKEDVDRWIKGQKERELKLSPMQYSGSKP